MAAVDIVPDMFAVQVPLNATSEQVIKVILLNADGSQSAVVSELRVPAGKILTGGFSVGGTVADAA